MKTQLIQRSPKTRRILLAATLGIVTPMAIGLNQARADEEWTEDTLLYEDDAWYDVSEWFDGNDYNPTDEAIGRWDNETYDVDEALTSTDQDNDIDWSDTAYGYYDGVGADDDWFYDYYDYGYYDYADYDADDDFDYTSQYYDYDHDGIYDAFASYTDTDGDGLFEDMNYYSFSSDESMSDEKEESMTDAKEKQASRQNKMTVIAGTIDKAKKVQTPNGVNLIVHLNDDSQNESMLVDLGPADEFKQMPKLGQKLTAKGVKFKAGDKTILLAQKLMRDSVTVTVNRSGRSYTGTIDGLMTAKVRGQNHRLAKVSTDQGKKLLVDMGPAEGLNADISEGKRVTVEGPAVKVNDRLMLIATEVEIDGDTVDIQRVALK